MENIKRSAEYRWAMEVYAKLVAKRSGVSYAKHVLEGAIILEDLRSADDTIKAFLIHPYYQDGAVFSGAPLVPTGFSPEAVALAVEYRWAANNCTSRVFAETGKIVLSEFEVVNEMLLADKVQNRKDFLAYNQNHPNFALLDAYFAAWLSALCITHEDYNRYCALIDDAAREAQAQQGVSS